MIVGEQWWIYIQKFLVCAPPNRPNSFIFTYVYTEKCPCWEVGAPSNEGWCPPMGNPGSAPGDGVLGGGLLLEL